MRHYYYARQFGWNDSFQSAKSVKWLITIILLCCWLYNRTVRSECLYEWCIGGKRANQSSKGTPSFYILSSPHDAYINTDCAVYVHTTCNTSLKCNSPSLWYSYSIVDANNKGRPRGWRFDLTAKKTDRLSTLYSTLLSVCLTERYIWFVCMYIYTRSYCW